MPCVYFPSMSETPGRQREMSMDAGRHALSFDGTNLPTGVYFYRITAGNRSDMKKMLLMK